MTFDEIKEGQRFRISGGLEELTRIPKTVIDGKLYNAEYASGPYKNEFLEIIGGTLVKKVKVITWIGRKQ